jgi:uncharacterized tellurite resistance protein B-like protein
MNQEKLRQLVQERYGCSPEQADQVIAVTSRAASTLQLAFASMAVVITDALDAWRHTDQAKELQAAFQALTQIEAKPQDTYRSYRPQDQGYNRTEFDRWRSSLGRGRGKRKL